MCYFNNNHLNDDNDLKYNLVNNDVNVKHYYEPNIDAIVQDNYKLHYVNDHCCGDNDHHNNDYDVVQIDAAILAYVVNIGNRQN